MRNAGTPFCEYINLCLHAIDSFNSCSCSAARQLKSSLIGSNKQKNLVIRHGVVPRLTVPRPAPIAVSEGVRPYLEPASRARCDAVRGAVADRLAFGLCT